MNTELSRNIFSEIYITNIFKKYIKERSLPSLFWESGVMV